MTATEFLRTQVSLLSGITAEEARALAEAAAQLQLSCGQTILFKGTTIEGLYVVAEGGASVWIKPVKTQPAINVAELGRGEVFGEMSLFGDELAGATVKAASDGTLVLMIPRETVAGLVESHPEIGSRIESLIASRRGVVPGSRVDGSGAALA